MQERNKKEEKNLTDFPIFSDSNILKPMEWRLSIELKLNDKLMLLSILLLIQFQIISHRSQFQKPHQIPSPVHWSLHL